MAVRRTNGAFSGGEAARGGAAAVAQVRGSEEFGDAFVWVLQTSFYRFFLTSSASEVSAPCDPDRTEVGIVALADHYNTQGP